MLSILIPTYNYDVYPLVDRLHQECVQLGINFEIICSDDASTVPYPYSKIESLSNCYYHIQVKNMGLSNSRNFLIEKSIYDYNLLLDCDTLPVSKDFVKKYLDGILYHQEKILSGGLRYQQADQAKSKSLRWIYGQSREAIPTAIRQKRPYNYSLCSNIFFNKKTLKDLRFDRDIKEYGYEDFIFFKNLQKRKIEVYHIENSVFHLKVESSLAFLNKTQQALQTLNGLLMEKQITKQDTSLLRTYGILDNLYLTQSSSWLFSKSQRYFEKNLLSDTPSLFLYDLYKLGYFCSLQRIK
ncbi:glycosyltransferase family 2 protein [Flavobacterium sp. HSC-61S13]|uniref:glycosyltransferase family 2 protein n=1 Tax=Flavobacterium sp. HSC-61S13 TaxID=2910963 RepID=UPI00209F575A|nr:glycosyltransferase family 2 protein [Flavobacterium sp. HSC-61S13]MCP1997202.1 glycosyltransferase involved in cell wall biosynthesis [Flavobacterium sp. HSC-61S13]